MRLIRISEVSEIVGLKDSAIYERIAENTFPKPIKIGRASRWVLDEIEAWVESVIQNGREV